MGDGDSIKGGLQDLGRETVKQIASVPKGIVASAAGQVLKHDTEEREKEKRIEKAATHARIKELEAEIQAIRAQNEQKKGPEVIAPHEKMEETQDGKPKKKLDEASRQAIGRAEQGRNFKG